MLLTSSTCLSMTLPPFRTHRGMDLTNHQVKPVSQESTCGKIQLRPCSQSLKRCLEILLSLSLFWPAPPHPKPLGVKPFEKRKVFIPPLWSPPAVWPSPPAGWPSPPAVWPSPPAGWPSPPAGWTSHLQGGLHHLQCSLGI